MACLLPLLHGSLADHPFPKGCPGLAQTNHRGLTLCSPGQPLSHSASVSPSVNGEFLLPPRNAVSTLPGNTGPSEVCRSLSPACVVCLVPQTPVLVTWQQGRQLGANPNLGESSWATAISAQGKESKWPVPSSERGLAGMEHRGQEWDSRC